MRDNIIRVPRKGPMNIGTACAIFAQLDSPKYEIEEKIEAIELVANMPTHNSISKDKILNALRWIFKHYDFSV